MHLLSAVLDASDLKKVTARWWGIRCATSFVQNNKAFVGWFVGLLGWFVGLFVCGVCLFVYLFVCLFVLFVSIFFI